jgi:hypothetical protein
MSDPMIVDIYAAALSVAQKPGTIRQWIHRGEITHRGYDKRRRVLVDLDELQRVVHDKALRARQEAA